MSQSKPRSYSRWLRNKVFVVVLILTVVALVLGIAAYVLQSSQRVATPIASGPLPGQQIWKQGVSSFLFGTTDTYEWSPHNIETEPAIQGSLRNAGFTLIRSFFPDNAADAAIEQRIHTIDNIGAHCLGVITNISNVTFDEHLVRYLGNRCLLYEFGNESDVHGLSIESYLKQWNMLIPLLRQINPNARFIGPVTYNYQGNHNFMQGFLEGVKASGTLPDAVSFHWYPCYHRTRENCLARTSTYGEAVQKVRALVQSILGKDLPIGVTEWNFDPSNPPATYGDDPNFITQFSSAALQSMAQAGVAFACEFDAASYAGYGHLDLFDVHNNDQPKPQYYAIKAMIAQYRPSSGKSAHTILSPVPGGGELVSRGRPVYCSTNNIGPGGVEAIVNGHYANQSFWRADLSSLPSWCAVHLNAGPTRLLLTWESDYYISEYINDLGMSPQDYTISVSSDSTNGADGTWQTVVTVVGNHAHAREHLLKFAGQAWVKMTVTQGQPQPSRPYVVIDQIDLYAVSASLDDTFFFSGDSITASAYNRSDVKQPSFAEDVFAVYPQRFPAMLDGGFGGWSSDAAVQNIDTWLSLNPDMHYWLLEWGTNDAFGRVSPEHFRANLQLLINKIKQAGHIPVPARLPYSDRQGDPGLDQEIQSLNAVIDQVTAANGLIPGPDFYQLFIAHAQDYLLPDGIHPTPVGAIAMNLAWFQALRPYIYK
jgi:lysophospholipase L1-like esterase